MIVIFLSRNIAEGKKTPTQNQNLFDELSKANFSMVELLSQRKLTNATFKGISFKPKILKQSGPISVVIGNVGTGS